MVKLEEVEDQDLVQAQPGPIKDEDYDSADFVDTGTSMRERFPSYPIQHFSSF